MTYPRRAVRLLVVLGFMSALAAGCSDAKSEDGAPSESSTAPGGWRKIEDLEAGGVCSLATPDDLAAAGFSAAPQQFIERVVKDPKADQCDLYFGNINHGWFVHDGQTAEDLPAVDQAKGVEDVPNLGDGARLEDLDTQGNSLYILVGTKIFSFWVDESTASREALLKLGPTVVENVREYVPTP